MRRRFFLGEANWIELEEAEEEAFLPRQGRRHRKANHFGNFGAVRLLGFRFHGTGHYDCTEETMLRRIIDRRKHRHTTHERRWVLVAETLSEALFAEQER